MSRRGGSILNGAPSLETSNQAQIDDLVQRNRTIEHTNKRLSEQLTREMSRSKEALETMRQEWVDKRQEWHQASTDLLTLCRIDQKRVEVELERERSNALQEMKFTRDEKLLRLQRDFRIKLFQMREEELERKIEEIEAEKQRNKGSSDLIVRKLEAKCAESLIQLKEEKEERAVAERERDEIERELTKLRETHAILQGSAESMKSKLERVKLQFEGSQTKNTEIQRANDDLKRANADLIRQLEKWQNLETKEGEEADSERKKRLALELEVKGLKEDLAKNGEQKEKLEADLLKEKRRVERMKGTVREWQAEAKSHEEDSAQLKKQLSNAQKQHHKLKNDLEVERVRVLSHLTEEIEEQLEVEEVSDLVENPSSPPSSPAKPASKQGLRPQAAPRSKRGEVLESKTEAGPSRTTVRQEKMKKATDAETDVEEMAKRKPRKIAAQDSDVEIIDAKKKGKGKAKAIDAEDEETEAVLPPKNKRKRATRQSHDDDDVKIVGERRAPTKKGKPESKRKEASAKPPSTKAKAESRARSIQPSGDEEDESAEGPARKKKRKINIFPATAGVFNFSNAKGGGLDIPSELSPVKESEPVPNRSITSSFMNSVISRNWGGKS
ncbi:hypothetical protein K443DRAFT_670697 [Laccaria amethystina LaAM-08-1]|uniref:Unplaced genomic scaffold K443scaffold_1, whole genome shotgun sequence n=1 Tax=Laccaria amethystina LaAM-08-1 TaxID=1095629 RepID=A0A0C9XCU7_9AGAR|nr:hypothetical protein K443DRAFT_670697 [Laccaria amethystina LaAM-08-1]